MPYGATGDPGSRVYVGDFQRDGVPIRLHNRSISGNLRRMPTARERGHLVHRDQLPRTVRESEGFAVYDAIVSEIDWTDSTPWRSLLLELNASQRAVVAVAQVHEHAQFNGIRATVEFHGREILCMASEGAVALGNAKLAALIDDALSADANWEQLERRWDEEASFEIERFIETHPVEFFIAD